MFQFTEKEVFHAGKLRKYKIVDHPGGAAVLAVQDDQILLIRQYRPAVNKTILEVPAGTIDPGEAPEIAARRELREETGFSAKSWRSLGQMLPTPGYSSETIYLFLAEDLSPGDRELDEGEEIELCWMKWSQIERLIDQGEITDGKTLLLLLRYRLDRLQGSN